jgi:hypothetical protein
MRSVMIVARFSCALFVLGAILATTITAAERSAEVVDALEGVFGKHKARASYAKGQCVKGEHRTGPVCQHPRTVVGISNDPASMRAGEEERKVVPLGRLVVTALEDNSVCDATVFDAHNLANGPGGPTDDPLFAARSAAYSVSSARRGK